MKTNSIASNLPKHKVMSCHEIAFVVGGHELAGVGYYVFVLFFLLFSEFPIILSRFNIKKHIFHVIGYFLSCYLLEVGFLSCCLMTP